MAWLSIAVHDGFLLKKDGCLATSYTEGSLTLLRNG